MLVLVVLIFLGQYIRTRKSDRLGGQLRQVTQYARPDLIEGVLKVEVKKLWSVFSASTHPLIAHFVRFRSSPRLAY
jgi:hypothetical protein